MQKSKKISLVVIAVIMIGFVMRSTFTTLPLMLGDLSQALDMPIGSLGILTTIPLVMFMLVSNFASKTIELLGLKRALLLMLITLALGAGLRIIIALPTMIIGSALIGIAIAHLNVFMPTLVATFFPTRVGLMTSIYSIAITVGSVLFNLSTASIVALTGWRSVLWLLFIIPLGVVVLWFLAMKRLPAEPHAQHKSAHKQAFKTWRNLKAWPFLLAFGNQSMLNYAFVAWLPVMMAYHHLSTQQVAIAMTLMAFTNIPVAMTVPNMLTRLSKRKMLALVIVMMVIGLTAAGMMFFQTDNFSFWILEALMAGLVIGFFFIFTMTMFAVKTQSPYQTASLSGMAQAGGYFIAAMGPSLYGIAYGINPLGNIQNICFVSAILIAGIATIFIVKMDHV